VNFENMDKETLIKILIQKENILQKLYLEKERLNYYASTDAMTGLLNRRSGLESLDKVFNFSKINDEKFVICFVDVDKLKIVNDTFGHEEGDKLLINLGKILTESIRKTDFVIRMGGDEFLVVFPKTTIKEANGAWHRICKRIEQTNKNSHNYNLSLSHGFYEYNNELHKEMSINDLIKKADAEMYKKKFKDRKLF
jgi:diguanylate cyclase (GGDEF)-like protein